MLLFMKSKKTLGQIFILHIFHSSQNYFNQL